jgi:hypothetical protein
VSFTTFLRTAYLSYFSSPASDRLIYQTIRRQQVRSILECGIGIGERATRMIEIARLVSPDAEIRYAGIDRFEARSAADGPGVTLKMAHRLLRGTHAKVRLIPGDTAAALAQVANSLGHTDLVVISARQDTPDLAAAWCYLPRILHPESQILLETLLPGGRIALRCISPSDVVTLATAARNAA